jgi:hypothetical protein
MSLRRAALGVLLVAGCAVVAGCGSNSGPPQGKAPAWRTLHLAMPAELAGYATAEERQAEAKLRQGGDASLLEGGAFWSLRRGTRLFATLEVGLLRATADIGDEQVRRGIVNQVGEQSRTQTVNGQTVYASTGDRQLIFVWFKGRAMHVLLTHDVSDPATLLAAAVRLP